MNSRRKKSFIKELKTLLTIIGIFWVIEIIDHVLFNGQLDRFGIRPHKLIGLRGILFAPFLHGSFSHLIANTIPFVTLGWLTMLQKTRHFYIVSVFSMIIGGLGIWIFGSPSSVHIGASILIYGYLGFLLLRGLFQKNIPSILLSLVVFFLYGGLLWGFLPSSMNISWEGHLFGFIGGAAAAWAIANSQKKQQTIPVVHYEPKTRPEQKSYAHKD
ncbi:putative membrane protein [Xenococcus sp. PCC 7305]|uniref:rhomboid family intramembrane serine protease n=1 Tax=Xenococcus sp. PCC 7305 TaxID=102125 RepID=UPI0002ACD0CA|nr:rhomboid family intramembrane serine protease [Xenococcus sp. PCC 7305]ELS04964.1 putative membrane protein [Xenococcus sp. PCC 7305]